MEWCGGDLNSGISGGVSRKSSFSFVASSPHEIKIIKLILPKMLYHHDLEMTLFICDKFVRKVKK